MITSRLLLALSLLPALGCSERTGAPAPPAASRPTASFGFKDLRSHDVVSGVIRVTAEGPEGSEKLELLADGAAHAPLGADRTASLDTTKLPDGLCTVALAAARGGGRTVLASAPVIVLNRGSEAFFKNGSSGKLSVPPAGDRPHQHLRYHFDLPEGIKRVLTTLSWEGEGFDLELALGEGTCPHHGTAHAKQTGRRSPVAVIHAAPEGQSLAAGQWFAHVDLKNAAEVAGKEASFSVKAFLLR